MTTNQQDAMEAAAEAMWQAESLRARGVERNIPWDEAAEKTKNQWREFASACVTAYLAAREAEGWVWTPSEPTEAMVEAGYSALMLGDDCFGAQSIKACHRAMLAARPTNGDS